MFEVLFWQKSSAAGGAVSFEVRDKPASLKSDDWGRVVGVFVLGKEWQFKDWPFKDHVEIFNRGVALDPFFLNGMLQAFAICLTRSCCYIVVAIYYACSFI